MPGPATDNVTTRYHCPRCAWRGLGAYARRQAAGLVRCPLCDHALQPLPLRRVQVGRRPQTYTAARQVE